MLREEERCDVTRMPRNHFTNRVDGVLGLACDIRARLRRMVASTKVTNGEDDLPALGDDGQQVMMDFDSRAARLLDDTYVPLDYDIHTLFITSTRLNNKLHKFPEDIKTAIKANVTDPEQLC